MKGALEEIKRALVLHRSMIECGEQPSASSEKAYRQALETITKMREAVPDEPEIHWNISPGSFYTINKTAMEYYTASARLLQNICGEKDE